MKQLIDGIRAGKPRSVARAISLVEDNGPLREAVVDAVFGYTGNASVWGVTGPPGAGKSTLVDKLISRERRRGRKVAVIAVDPSSPFSGGALLGDRLRMQQHSTDDGVFIRSMASRGHLGGVAGATFDAVKILDAAGYDTVIIETIGVGQTEVDIIEMSDLVMLVLVPGMGDEIQAMKAGVMEIGDIFIVNKCDRDGAERLKAEIDYVLGIKYADDDAPMNPVLLVSAVNDEGVDELLEESDKYLAGLAGSGALVQKRKNRLEKELRKIFSVKIHEMLDIKMDFYNNVGKWVDDLYNKKTRPYALIDDIMRVFKKECERI